MKPNSNAASIIPVPVQYSPLRNQIQFVVGEGIYIKPIFTSPTIWYRPHIQTVLSQHRYPKGQNYLIGWPVPIYQAGPRRGLGEKKKACCTMEAEHLSPKLSVKASTLGKHVARWCHGATLAPRSECLSLPIRDDIVFLQPPLGVWILQLIFGLAGSRIPLPQLLSPEL